jgi:hypothetical protein
MPVSPFVPGIGHGVTSKKSEGASGAKFNIEDDAVGHNGHHEHERGNSAEHRRIPDLNNPGHFLDGSTAPSAQGLESGVAFNREEGWHGHNGSHGNDHGNQGMSAEHRQIPDMDNPGHFLDAPTIPTTE